MDKNLFVVLENQFESSHFEGIFFTRSDADLFIEARKKSLTDRGFVYTSSSFSILCNKEINMFFRLAAFYRNDE